MDTLSFTPRIASQMHVRIVDSDLQVCETLSVVFRLEGFQTSFSTDWEKALSSKTAINVLLINFELEEGSGLSLLRQAKADFPGTPVFMLANTPDVDAAVLAMKLGAVDVIRKPIDVEHLVQMVRDTLRRDVHLLAYKDGKRKVELGGFPALTVREREVLQLIVNGNTSKAAGTQLGISFRTIEVHRGRVMEKLGARNLADLMRIVMSR